MAIFRETGSLKGYLKSGWNYIDVTSIALCLSTIVLWLSFIIMDARTFSMEPRYHVLASLSSKGRWQKLSEDHPDDFEEMTRRFDDMSRMTDFQVRYMMQNGLNSFFLICRILKLCDFQPRMGIITRTLAIAASDLYHFFLLLFIIFIGYSITGHLLFGTTLYSFSTAFQSGLTLFNMMVFGDNSVSEDLFDLGTSQGSAMGFTAIVFYVSYALLVVMVLINFLLAIVMDSFSAVKDSIKDSTSIGHDLLYYGKTLYRQYTSHVPPEGAVVTMIDKLRSAEDCYLKELIGQPSSPIWQEHPLGAAGDQDDWQDQILIRGKHLASVSGAEVRQTLEEASETFHKYGHLQERASKTYLGSSESDKNTVINIRQQAKKDTNFDAISVARRVMEKFGQNEEADDADEEKRLAKEQHQQILDTLQMLAQQQRTFEDRVQGQLRDIQREISNKGSGQQ
ncbi:hypothetical protein CYMTET_14057 [Cymbomonas tetramitiformis]|uniref:Polycystin cation channel PKD1/PKD2 domain-containing protein n=1 Tax=Cymbomonas tetramitiformis TaxID=36881 RepID=A0AAE0GH47_9CHLO|nr:hypothetical protein CYMTET_14057 [Cymbomonas tetramitiformis]